MVLLVVLLVLLVLLVSSLWPSLLYVYAVEEKENKKYSYFIQCSGVICCCVMSIVDCILCDAL